MHETFLTLLRDRAHWEFELFGMIVFDGLIGALLWPFIRRHWHHHIQRDRREKVVPINRATLRVLCSSQYGGAFRAR